MVIAIDGHSACGKSTLAKDLAKHLGFLYIDSGAMYRAATLYFIKQNIKHTDLENINNHLDKIHIELQSDETLKVLLNGKNVTDDIRSQKVTDQVSEYSAIPGLRKNL